MPTNFFIYNQKHVHLSHHYSTNNYELDYTQLRLIEIVTEAWLENQSPNRQRNKNLFHEVSPNSLQKDSSWALKDSHSSVAYIFVLINKTKSNKTKTLKLTKSNKRRAGKSMKNNCIPLSNHSWTLNIFNLKLMEPSAVFHLSLALNV